jgi:hypothetical protein
MPLNRKSICSISPINCLGLSRKKVSKKEDQHQVALIVKFLHHMTTMIPKTSLE